MQFVVYSFLVMNVSPIKFPSSFFYLSLSSFFLMQLYFLPQLGVFAGIALAIVLSGSFSNIAELFTKDAEVLQIVKSGVLVCIFIFDSESHRSIFESPNLCFNSLQFVCITQPINSLAFIFDGLHYGVSDFSYAAYSSVSCTSDFLLYSFYIQ